MPGKLKLFDEKYAHSQDTNELYDKPIKDFELFVPC